MRKRLAFRQNISAILLSFPLLLFAQRSAAQPASIIEQLLESRASLVDVYALEEEQAEATEEDPVPSEKRGAGIVLDRYGLIITNLHTISFTKKIAVEAQDHTITGAKILKIMPTYDLVLIKIAPHDGLEPIQLADSDDIHLGDEVFNIGNSRLLKETLSAGRIVGIGRDETTGEVSLIKIMMYLYKGDSGGPLFNADGRLIGMVMGKLKRIKDAVIAIPSNKIRIIYNEISNGGIIEQNSQPPL